MVNIYVNVVARLFWSIENVTEQHLLDNNVNDDLYNHLRSGILLYMTDILDNSDVLEEAMNYRKYDEDAIERVVALVTSISKR